MIQTDKELEELRKEFNKLWPDMWKRIGPILDQEPNLHMAAFRACWIVWLSGKGELPENFLKQPTP